MIFFLRRLTQRQQIRQLSTLTNASIKLKLLRLLVILLLIISTHVAVIAWLEKISVFQALWLTLTTITTVGYGDISAQTTGGKLATILFMYILGIWVLAQLAGEYLDFRLDRKDRMVKGQWIWKKMKEHILIINTPSLDGDRYLLRLVKQIRQTPKLATLPIQIVTDVYPHGLPESLRVEGVVHYHTDTSEPYFYQDINVEQAGYILVLCKEVANTTSDSVTLDILDHLSQYSHHANVVSECILDENQPRFLKLGSTSVMRPIRAYPELIVRALSDPGTEKILENLFTFQGVATQRYEININDKEWGDVSSCLIKADLGTPLGYIKDDNEIITNPSAKETISSKAIILMVNEKRIPEAERILSCIEGI